MNKDWLSNINTTVVAKGVAKTVQPSTSTILTVWANGENLRLAQPTSSSLLKNNKSNFCVLIVIFSIIRKAGKMLPLPRLNFTGKPDAVMSCLSGLEGAGRKRTSTMVQRVALRPYLHPLDHFVKRELKCPAYLRYVDDYALFADDKQTLHYWREAIVDYLATLRLAIHAGRAHPRPVSEGIPFLGFVVYPDHRRVKRRKVVAYRRRLKRLWSAYQQGVLEPGDMVASLRGWLAHISYGDTWALAEQILQPIVFSGGQL